MDRFEWDDAKDRANRAKHGIGFAEAVTIFAGPVLTRVDSRRDYGETREISMGLVGDDVVIVVVHTQREKKTRIISARKANADERRVYNARIKARIEKAP